MKIMLRSTSVGARWLEFSQARGRGSDFKCLASLVRDGEETSVELEMIGPYRRDMLGFFEEIAAEREGWTGSKKWESEFAEMSISATNDGSGVTSLNVSLAPQGQDWFAEETLEVRTDDFSKVAREMKQFLAVESGDRFQAVDDS